MRIALVHDWLTGMRGGEKCLEALCHHWPQADIYTLFKRSNSLSEAIERHPLHTSFLQRFPGIVVVVIVTTLNEYGGGSHRLCVRRYSTSKI